MSVCTCTPCSQQIDFSIIVADMCPDHAVVGHSYRLRWAEVEHVLKQRTARIDSYLVAAPTVDTTCIGCGAVDRKPYHQLPCGHTVHADSTCMWQVRERGQCTRCHVWWIPGKK